MIIAVVLAISVFFATHKCNSNASKEARIILAGLLALAYVMAGLLLGMVISFKLPPSEKIYKIVGYSEVMRTDDGIFYELNQDGSIHKPLRIGQFGGISFFLSDSIGTPRVEKYVVSGYFHWYSYLYACPFSEQCVVLYLSTDDSLSIPHG